MFTRVARRVHRSVRPAFASHFSSSPVETVEPLLQITIGQAFDDAVKKFGSHPYVHSPAQPNMETLTYTQMGAQVDQVAKSFLALGLNKGDRIGIYSHNNVEYLITFFAACQLGLIPVLINPAYKEHELSYSLYKSGARALVAAQMYKDMDCMRIVNNIIPQLSQSSFTGDLQSSKYVPINNPDLPFLQHVIHLGNEQGGVPAAKQHIPGMLNFQDFFTNNPLVAAYEETLAKEHKSIAEVYSERKAMCDQHDIINMQLTSGTTNLSKVVALTHHNILNNGIQIANRLEVTQNDRVLVQVPLFHCFGTVIGILANLTKGATNILPHPTFSATKSVEMAAKYKATNYLGVPTMFIAILNSPAFKQHGATLKQYARSGVVAGSTCTPELLKHLHAELNLNLLNSYGMTETSPLSCTIRLSDSFEHKTQTVGTVLPHVEVKIVDPVTRERVPNGTVGELCTKGYGVMKGYWHIDGIDQKTTDENIIDGFMHSGDLASIDDDGYVRIVSRLKDIIIKGGENINPSEIEQVLATHELILDSYVIAVPDPVYGEEIGVYVTLKEGASMTPEQVQMHVASELAKFKVPKYVKFLDEVPKTVSGKPQKFIMRTMMKQALEEEGVLKASA